MAFVYRAERKTDSSDKENTQVGPGAYLGPKEIKPKPMVYQPFQAQSGRANNMKQVSQTVYNPGPGSYQPTLGFEQISKNMVSAKNLSMYGLEKFGITVIKPQNSFASRVDRFSTKQNKEKTNLPGPGSYVGTETNWIKSKRQTPKPEWQQVTWNKMQNPPSIPSHNNVFGYEENEHGELLKQKNAEVVHTGVKYDTVGPGKYEIVKSLGSNIKGPTWHVSKTPVAGSTKANASLKKEQAVAPGPGHYNADKVEIFPIYKYKPTSVFVSKVHRDTTGALHHKIGGLHSLPPKPQSQQNISRNNIMENNSDYYEDDEDDNYRQTPGPGAYYNPGNSTTFKVKDVPERLQFFGSTVDRFATNNIMKQQVNGGGSNLGPGTYSINSSGGQPKKMKTGHDIPFASSNQRFNDLQQKQQIEVPGPGTYQDKCLVDQISKKPWGKQGVFGSTEKRFVLQQALPTPGPGQYKPERSVNVLDHKRDTTNIKRSSSMFISSTNRNPYNEPKNQHSVVQYDLSTNTISEQVRRNVEVGLGNNLLTDLKIKKKLQPGFGFSSHAPRFNGKKINEADAFLGPGYYEQQSTFESQKASQALGTLKNQQFLGTAPRFGDHVKNSHKKSETPGPGHYCNEDLNGWFKRTYNMIFTE